MNRTTIALASALALVSLGGGARAQDRGWGDTGWVFGSKRACCSAALDLAHQDGVLRCDEAGGRPPSLPDDRRRGRCTWTWKQDANGEVVYRCQSEVRSRCR